jgi:hypothetical protein
MLNILHNLDRAEPRKERYMVESSVFGFDGAPSPDACLVAIYFNHKSNASGALQQVSDGLHPSKRYFHMSIFCQKYKELGSNVITTI